MGFARRLSARNPRQRRERGAAVDSAGLRSPRLARVWLALVRYIAPVVLLGLLVGLTAPGATASG
jgi:hypothetical protein